MENKDWFNNLKIEIINTSLLLSSIQSRATFVLKTHNWILEDINLCESISHLVDMLNISSRDLNRFIKDISLLEDSGDFFSSNDLVDEFEYIKENVNLEASYLTNIVDYINIIINPGINGTIIAEKLEKYHDIDLSCYNQMKINNKQLKQLRKERRN